MVELSSMPGGEVGGIVIECRFTSSDRLLWVPILKGLAKGENGALLQDRMDIFGPEVAQHLEVLLERWPSHYFTAHEVDYAGDEFVMQLLVSSADAINFTRSFSSLLAACGAHELNCSVIDLSGD
ncbi:hypothetical protein [Allohahella sp. A8]|uniref:hypothetical protein n=1 Tax=Allohahella sp. A8 TaxID=3141461 RepID=UPI003A812587